jgi:predicted Holliday junction resolvase-like endonuclease|tara:strand:+ start:201 stop:410 length:210 start_codon:yes stop_codon:yes gene_type:complete
MEADLVFVMLVFSLLAIIFVISKLNRAIKLLNNRVNMHSTTLKEIKKDKEVGMHDEDEAIQQILDREFK